MPEPEENPYKSPDATNGAHESFVPDRHSGSMRGFVIGLILGVAVVVGFVVAAFAFLAWKYNGL